MMIRGCIDSVASPNGSNGQTVVAGDVLDVRGWIFPPGDGARILVDRRHAFPVTTGEPRPDVAAALGTPDAAFAGFWSAVATAGLAPGRHEIELVSGVRGDAVVAKRELLVEAARGSRKIGDIDDTMFHAVQGVETQVVQATWYRGDHCNFNPTKADLREPDAIFRHVTAGWLPRAPFITRSHGITAFGSCFAGNISEHLAKRSYRVLTDKRHADVNGSYVIRCAEGIVNTYAVRQQFEWALEGAAYDEDLWYGSRGELAPYNDQIRRDTAGIFSKTDVFIITLGLAEVWYSTTSGDVFWRAIPANRFDPAVHGFRLTSVDENVENLTAVRRIIRAHRPDATIVFTLSPIPLHATFRPISCVTANSVSKAIMRVAIDEMMRAFSDDPKLLYFPAYEIVREAFADPFLDDNRHIKPEILSAVVNTFEAAYCLGE